MSFSSENDESRNAETPESDRVRRGHIRSESADEALRMKRQRNAEAAKRCRERKKKEESAKQLESESRTMELNMKIVQLQRQNKDLLSERSQWKTKESYFMNALRMLRYQIQRYKEYVSRLDAELMAFNLSGRSTMSLRRYLPGTMPNTMGINGNIPMMRSSFVGPDGDDAGIIYDGTSHDNGDNHHHHNVLLQQQQQTSGSILDIFTEKDLSDMTLEEVRDESMELFGI